MADEIFKNNGKISTKCPPTVFWVADYEFFVRFTKFKTADSRFTFWKNTVKYFFGYLHFLFRISL